MTSYAITVEAKLLPDKVLHRSVIFTDLTMDQAKHVIKDAKRTFIRLYSEGKIDGVENLGWYNVRAIAQAEDYSLSRQRITVDYTITEITGRDIETIDAIESCLLINLDDPKTISS